MQGWPGTHTPAGGLAWHPHAWRAGLASTRLEGWPGIHRPAGGLAWHHRPAGGLAWHHRPAGGLAWQHRPAGLAWRASLHHRPAGGPACSTENSQATARPSTANYLPPKLHWGSPRLATSHGAWGCAWAVFAVCGRCSRERRRITGYRLSAIGYRRRVGEGLLVGTETPTRWLRVWVGLVVATVS